jgi:hypothetical protein
MSRRNSGYARKRNDAYQTPPWVVHALVPFLPRGITTIWEPAAGRGQLVRALRETGYHVLASDRDYDFLSEAPKRADAIVTNPPYKLAVAFIERGLTYFDTTAMLLSIDFDSAVTRSHLFDDPRWMCKVVLRHRIRWFPGEHGPSENHAWYIWKRGHRGSPRIGYARHGPIP